MVNLTERAKQALVGALVWASADDPEIGLRLIYTEGKKFAVIPDSEKEGDHVVKYGSSKILLIEPIVARMLEGVTIDFQETTEGDCLLIWT